MEVLPFLLVSCLSRKNRASQLNQRHSDVYPLLQDRTLYSALQHGCIWTKLFLAWKVFLASGLGIYLLETAFFRCQWKNPLAFLFPKMAISDATGRFPWCSCFPARKFPMKTLQEIPHAGREPAPYVIPVLYYTSELQMLLLTNGEEKKYLYIHIQALPIN
jgi:hypothetical protein